MPDKRTHRGANPADSKLFADAAIDELRLAVHDFSMLITKGYAAKSSLKLVCDKFSLTLRQRLAVMRSGCSDEQLKQRTQRQVRIEQAKKQRIAIDGYNVLITIEAAMGGGCIFKARDGCFRDLASIHGTYRKVSETIPALQLIGEFLKEKEIADCLWLLDSPVSNSARLKMLMGRLAKENNWNWDIELAISPDARLIKTDAVAATSDSVILGKCKRWVNLTRAIIEAKIPNTWLVDLS